MLNDHVYRFLIEPWLPFKDRAILQRKDLYLWAHRRLKYEKYKLLLLDICIHHIPCDKRYCICRHFNNDDKKYCFDIYFQGIFI